MSRDRKRQLQRRQNRKASGTIHDASAAQVSVRQHDGGELEDESISPDHIKQSLARFGQLDEESPWDSFVDLVIGVAVGATGKRLGILIRAGTNTEERLTLPEPVLGNLKSFKSWLGEHGFPALIDVATDASLEYLARGVSRAAREIHLVLEREGITQVKGSGALVGCYGGHLYAQDALEEKLAPPPTISQVAGTVESWNEAVAPHLLRAPVLLFAVGLALTPAIFWRTEECLAFEFVGPPGAIDERIAAQVAASVGDRADDALPWVSVKPALARFQEAGRCRLLALDDIADDDRRLIAEVCGQQQFAMGPAIGRSAAAAVLLVGTAWKTAGARLIRNTWRSSHELGLTGISTPRAGSLSDFDDDAADEEARAMLADAVQRHYGCLLPDFLQKLVERQDVVGAQFDELRHHILGDLVTTRPQPLTGIERRVAAKFAIVGATLELALRHDVLALAAGCGSGCAAMLFGKWLQNWRVRDGNVHRVAAQWLQQKLRECVPHLPTFDQECKSLPLGFRGKHEQHEILWIFPNKFQVLCGDFDATVCVEALDHYGALMKARKGLQFRKRLPGALMDSLSPGDCDPVESFYAIRVNFIEAALG